MVKEPIKLGPETQFRGIKVANEHEIRAHVKSPARNSVVR